MSKFPWGRRSAAELTLGGWHFALIARIDRERCPQRPRQTLETGFGDMMGVVAVERLDMQGDAGVHGKGVEPFAHQLGVELADLVAREAGAEHQHRPARYIDNDAGQGLVHWHVD